MSRGLCGERGEGEGFPVRWQCVLAGWCSLVSRLSRARPPLLLLRSGSVPCSVEPSGTGPGPQWVPETRGPPAAVPCLCPGEEPGPFSHRTVRLYHVLHKCDKAQQLSALAPPPRHFFSVSLSLFFSLSPRSLFMRGTAHL